MAETPYRGSRIGPGGPKGGEVIRQYHYEVKMTGFEPVAGTTPAANVAEARHIALSAFEIANDIVFEPGEGITIADRIKFYSPKVSLVRA